MDVGETPRFSADGSKIFTTYGDRGHQVLARLTLKGDLKVIIRDLGDEGAYSVAENGTVAFATASTTRPSDAAVLLSGGDLRRLTGLNEDLLANKALADARPLTFRSPADGVEIRALLVMPPGAALGRRYPMILSIHGGPHAFDEPTWSVQDQLLAAAGYALLHVDYRGSLSYGFAFADRIARDFPGAAYDDLMAAVDAAIATGVADPDRLFVTGGSAGGELTAWIVGRTHRFKAAAAVKPVINAVSEGLTTVQYGSGRSSYGAYPWENPQLYWQRSPLSLVDHVTTPTMLMVGENDHNTPAGEAEQFYAALKLLEIPAALVIVPDAGHASITGTPSRQIAESAILRDWFSKNGGLPAPVVFSKQ